MQMIWSKIAVLFIWALGTVIQIANIFVGNIIIYETTEKISFDWEKLIHSRLFWGVVIVEVSHSLLSFLINRTARKNDDQVECAIDKNVVKLYNTAGKFGRKKDFESAEKVLDIIDKLEERRKR